MNTVRTLLYLFCGMLFLFSFTQCERTIKTGDDYLKWLQQKENGFIQKAEVNGWLINAVYLPPEYLALQALHEISNPTPITFDSLVYCYQKETTFLFTIQEQSTFRSVESRKQTNNQIRKTYILDNLDNYLRLHVGTKTLKPNVSIHHNINQVSKRWTTYLVFKTQQEQHFDIDLAFNGEELNTGFTHFEFPHEIMQALPKLESVR